MVKQLPKSKCIGCAYYKNNGCSAPGKCIIKKAEKDLDGLENKEYKIEKISKGYYRIIDIQQDIIATRFYTDHYMQHELERFLRGYRFYITE